MNSCKPEQQLLIFCLAGELFGIDILCVKEIRALAKIRKVPDLPQHITGVFDYRDNIVPVVDLTVKLSSTAVKPPPQSVMIIINVTGSSAFDLVAIVVDSVLNVGDFSLQALRDLPKMSEHIDNPLVTGMLKYEENLLMVINTQALNVQSQCDDIYAEPIEAM